MRQCKLIKENKELTTWIDVDTHDKGRFVDLKTDDGYDIGWQIVEVGSMYFDKKEINERSRDYKNMRKMTDI